VAVLATQYASGGSGEWGGRYFALGLPLVVPVILLALRNLAASFDRTTVRIATAALCLLTASLSVLAVMTLRDQHDETDAMAAAVDATARSHPAADGGPPVVLSSDGAAARFAFPVVDRTRWLTTDDDHLAAYATRLRELAVGSVTFVTRDVEDLREVEGSYRAEAAVHPGGKWIVFVLVAR
jgi:hypothetical protein